jgi:hypothetical protein
MMLSGVIGIEGQKLDGGQLVGVWKSETANPAGGLYTFFVLLTIPNAAADGTLGPGDVVAVSTVTTTSTP